MPPVPWLDTTDDEGSPWPWPSKARRLATAARAGLPVPRGLVLSPEPAALDEPSIRAAVEQLLRQGPVVVRSALCGEDEAEGSAAGLGRSHLDCTDLSMVRRALEDLKGQRDDPWLQAYRRTTTGHDAAIVQQQITRRALLVVAVPPQSPPEVEVHTADGEALAEGRTPEYAGRLAGWTDPTRPAVEALVERVVARLDRPEHGHDLEIVIDGSDAPFVVQARPLTAPLHPGWPDFRAALDEEDDPPSLHGVLTLDAEHNPAPLSPAHAWLMERLRQQRPKAGDPTVLAGWLFVRTLPRDLARRDSAAANTATPSGAPAPPSAIEVVRQLHRTILPEARARLDALVESFAAMDPPALADALDDAEQAFLTMIDAYVGVLIPARTRARRALGGRITASPSRPLSTRGRDEFLDVLPATWDLASPSLASLGARPANDPPGCDPPESDALPHDEATAATLLGEWDDHLFALGLAPLRAWFLAAAPLLSRCAEDIFMLTGAEVAQALRGRLDAIDERIARRTATWRHQATLRPPLRIEDGRPVSFGRRSRLRGIPLGPSHTGPLAPRADLTALLADPPGPDAIVTLPALTAPAAVALQQLGVRAVCCEHGGPLSHAALMARELSLSALIGCRGCTELPAGRRARLDTTAGRLVLDPTS